MITRILRVVERKMDGPSAYVKVEELTEEGKKARRQTDECNY